MLVVMGIEPLHVPVPLLSQFPVICMPVFLPCAGSIDEHQQDQRAEYKDNGDLERDTIVVEQHDQCRAGDVQKQHAACEHRPDDMRQQGQNRGCVEVIFMPGPACPGSFSRHHRITCQVMSFFSGRQ